VALFAGIDGGQSGTQAVIGDEERVLARGAAGPADEIGADASSTRLRDALENALIDALHNGRLPANAEFAAVVAGVSGYEGRVYGAMPHMPSPHFELVHDAVIAHAGAFAGGDGVVVIAGTGSAAYARASDGRTRTAGGWGYLFGDEGSAFWIARTYFERAAAGALDPRPLLEFFDYKELHEIARALYAGAITRDRFAGFARAGLKNAGIAEDAARELALLARSCVIERPCALAFVGGLLGDAAFGARVSEAARRELPDCTIVSPLADPAEGALILARRVALT